MVGENEKPPDPLRVLDTLSADPSTGCTDEKHMLYIRSLELSFVMKLYDGQVNSNGVLGWSPGVWRHNTHNGNHKNTQVDEVSRGMVEEESRESRAEHTESPSCDVDQDDRKAYFLDDEASNTDPRQAGMISYYASRKNFGVSSTSYMHCHGYFFSETEPDAPKKAGR